jgi:YesN/AraC family two-component response regulator
MNQNTVYKVTDTYLCNYLFHLLPEKKSTALLIGPYMSVQLSREQLLQEAEHHAIPPALFRHLEAFYGSIPVITDDTFLLAVVNTFAEALWGGSDSYTVVDLTNELSSPSPLSLRAEPLSPDQALLDMHTMEQRYAYENELLKAVSQGLQHKANMMLSNMSQFAMEARVADPVRNIKNYCIIMNTLLRKAAEEGGVHPLYLDSVSSDFARRIEPLSSTAAAQKLMDEMMSSYCRLVKKNSLGHYSAPIRKTLACIDADLTGDLSLSSLAAMQNISPGYLSSLFKKEVGQTLTDYVNSRRIDQAARMLRSGTLQVQTVAQYCGIPDVNYFSKLFKRYIGVSPKEFRQTLAGAKEKG